MKLKTLPLLFILITNISFAGVDAGISSIITPNGNLCGQGMSSFQPVILLQNFGTSVLNSCTIKYQVDNNALQTFSWSGSLPAAQTISVTLNYINTYSGSHSFKCFSENPNGGSDIVPANDSSKCSFYFPQFVYHPENFDGGKFPPVGWKIINPDNNIGWDSIHTDSIHKTSLYIANFQYNDSSKGQVDEIISPPVILGTYPEIFFQYSNKKYTDPASNPVYADTLDILISGDCGSTWTSVWKKYGTQLITASPSFDTSEYIPKANEWRSEYIGSGLLPWANKASLVKFHHTTDCENNFYLDNILFDAWLGINESTLNSAIEVSPNPFKESTEVILNQNSSKSYSIHLLDVLGRKLFEDTFHSSKYILEKGSLYSGIYFLRIFNDQNILIGSKKVIVQ